MDSPKASGAFFHALLAFVISLIAAGIISAWECGVGTTDQCLISKGLFPYYWAVLFVVLWPLIPVVGRAMRDEDESSADSDPD